MKIISKYKDYYDYISHQYGVDNTIIYNRDKPFDTVVSSKEFNTWKIRFEEFKIVGEIVYNIRWIAICGRWYPVCSLDTKQEYSFVDKEYFDTVLKKHSKLGYHVRDSYEQFNNEVYNKDILKLHKLLGSPVFEIRRINRDPKRYTRHDVNEYTFNNSPMLSNLGIPGIYPSEKIYMDIAYYIGNILKDAPDMKPPVELDDKYKITGHGFDMKQSFRHRT